MSHIHVDEPGHNHNDHGHSHSHEEHSHEEHSKKRCCKLTKTQSLIIMLIMTFLFFFAEIIVGYLTKSNSLIADSFHMLSDVIALIIGLVAVRMSKLSSSRNTYGWVRAEILGSLINAVFLLALCFSIIVESIGRFVRPEPLEKVDLMLIIAGIGLGINLIGMLIFGLHGHEHGHSHGGHSHKKEIPEVGIQNVAANFVFDELNRVQEIEKIEPSINVIENKKEKKKIQKKKKSSKNMNIYGVFLHVLSDALGSIAVMISGFIVKYAPPVDDSSVSWKLYIDPALSVIIVILIIISTIPLLKESSLVLLQTVPQQYKINELKSLIKSVRGVLDVHHFHIWSLNSEKIIASAHIRVIKQDNDEELIILHEIKKLLHKNDIHSTTLQLEYDSNFNEHNYDYCEGNDCRIRQCCPTEQIKLINSENFSTKM